MRLEALSLGLTVPGTLFYCVEVAGSGSRPRKKIGVFLSKLQEFLDSLREDIN